MFIKMILLAIGVMILAIPGLMLGMLVKKNGRSPAPGCRLVDGGTNAYSGCCCMDYCKEGSS
ncbi:MAG: hypothetical protein ACP5D1_03370 [Bacteroidales bacterium]